jgi:hypothetical protein
MTQGAAVGRVQRVARAVVAASEPCAVEKLLERLAADDAGPELRAALVALGAEAAIAEARRERMSLADREAIGGNRGA